MSLSSISKDSTQYSIQFILTQFSIKDTYNLQNQKEEVNFINNVL